MATQDPHSGLSGDGQDHARPTTSTRDLNLIGPDLGRWLSGKLGLSGKPGLTGKPESGTQAQVTNLCAPSTNGMSSETVLFDARWEDENGPQQHALVARLAPPDSAVPVFPEYDLDRQFSVMALVGARSEVPVPPVWWSEPDPAVLGTPFFVMSRIDGDVPPDVMPYNFGSWLSEADPADQARLQESSVAVLARLHATRAGDEDLAFLASPGHGSDALERHVNAQWSYYQWVADGVPSPLLEACFGWLWDHWPRHLSPTLLSWGDARIGNMMFRDFEPVAVLDWEMASVAPPEVDLAWFIFLHRFFEDLASGAGLAGMPDFLRRDDVASTYERVAGYEPKDLDFFTMYAALRHGIVMSRVMRRSIHFGEATMPEDVDDLIMHRATLQAMLAGTYRD
ncbi:MAG: phosphotransferase family protein [Acidimicrobiales bacterium]